MILNRSKPHKGQVVGYEGHRAVVVDVIEHGRRVRVNWFVELDRRECDGCGGAGWVSLGLWRSKLRTTACAVCRGTGELPPSRELQDEWVDAGELTPPPIEREHPLAAEVGGLLSNPQAVFGDGS